MAVRVPRQDRGEMRRAALVTAAVAVVGEGGPAEFSARAVATQAKLPLGAVSYYFPVLDELLGEALAAVLSAWLEHGESVAATTKGRGIACAAAAITAALLPAGGPDAVRHRYEHLLAAGRNPVAAAAMAALRPELEGLVARILISTTVSTPLTSDALLALVDGAALGGVAEGADDAVGRVRTTLAEALRASTSR